MKLEEHVPLAPFTTFGVGGEARFFVEAQSVEEVVEALEFARVHSLKVFVLGGGSNILIADDGFDGVVIVLRIQSITEETYGGNTLVTAGAGVVWDEFVVWTIEHGYIGLECMSGVPGTVGGAVVVNLGCYGAQCSDTFIQAEVLDTQGRRNEIKIVKKEECNFSYHESTFSQSPGRYLVLQATFALSTSGTSRLSYKDNRFDLEALATASGHEPTLKEVRATVLKMRAE
ncbi:MAG: FAD-binding protein, partial [bacterium]|nr:FAD-binding protein [bacterium]